MVKKKFRIVKDKIEKIKQKRDAYARKIKSSPNLQIYRKLLHILLGAIILLLSYTIYSFYGPTVLIYLFFLVLLISTFIDLLRVEFNINFILYTIFTKKKEERNFTALTFGFLAIVLSLALYNFKIALAALSMSHFSDAIAAIVGIKFGKHRFKNGKSLEGSLASLITNLLIGYFLLKVWYIFIPMAIIATLTELVITHMDDNFVVPIFTGFTGQLILILASIY